MTGCRMGNLGRANDKLSEYLGEDGDKGAQSKNNPKVATKQFIQISKPVLEFMGLREMRGSEEGGEGD